MPDGTAAEVCFVVDYGEQFDQAGLLVRADAHSWIKAGVEVSDGELQVGAVVTREASDWSLGPVPHWAAERCRYCLEGVGVAEGSLVEQVCPECHLHALLDRCTHDEEEDGEEHRCQQQGHHEAGQ